MKPKTYWLNSHNGRYGHWTITPPEGDSRKWYIKVVDFNAYNESLLVMRKVFKEELPMSEVKRMMHKTLKSLGEL